MGYSKQSMQAIWFGFGLVCFLMFVIVISTQVQEQKSETKMPPEIKQLSAVALPSADRIVGSWYFVTEWSRPFKITLFRKDGKLYEQIDHSDASPKTVHEMELSSSGEITFKPMKYLEYTTINQSGDLELHFRKEGEFETGRPLSYYKKL